MDKTQRFALIASFACGIAAPVGAQPAAAPATAAEPPAQLEQVDVTGEKRVELAFRAVQLGLRRGRSDRMEDADLIVCMKQTPVGSHLPVINCATNRKWSEIRARSLQNGLSGLQSAGGPAGGGDIMARATGNMGGNMVNTTGIESAGPSGDNGAAKRDDDKVLIMSLTDYNKLQKRFGELPKELQAAPAVKGD